MCTIELMNNTVDKSSKFYSTELEITSPILWGYSINTSKCRTSVFSPDVSILLLFLTFHFYYHKKICRKLKENESWSVTTCNWFYDIRRIVTSDHTKKNTKTSGRKLINDKQIGTFNWNNISNFSSRNSLW